MSETTLIFTPSIGQPWPEQGGIYIGSRLIDGQTHHVIIPGGTEYDIRANYNNAAERIAAKGEINGFSDWHHGSQEDVMLAYINVPDLFCREGFASIQATSSPYGQLYAWAVYFENGRVFYWSCFSEFRARPFRSIPKGESQ